LSDLKIEFEVLFVNDGSSDNSSYILSELSKKNTNIKVINFSRNYGHEAAMIAGIDYSSGDVVICMDADLQNPPEKIKDMVEKYLKGFDIVTMRRVENEGASISKKIASKIFYSILNLISPIKFEPNTSDFFLISNRIADILRTNFRERNRFLRGFLQMLGFSRATIDYVAPERAAGKSKYSYAKLFKLSLTAVATFSNLPLRLGVIFGIFMGALSIVVGIYSLVMKLLGYVIPGYTTVVVLISFLFAVQLFVTGLIGEYLGFLFEENKKRPIYIVDKVISHEQHNGEVE